MSYPFVIWTVRRTGGTTLTDVLMAISEHPKIDHEPFNEGRSLGEVGQNWYEHHDRDRTRALLQEALAAQPLIKHCFELHDHALNQMILNVSRRMGYRHILLTRDDEVARILSLELAKATGVWGKMGSERGYAALRSGEVSSLVFDEAAALKQLETCFRQWAWLGEQMARVGVTPHHLRFEDIYLSVDSGLEAVRGALSFLGFPSGTLEANSELINNALRYRGQNSAKMLDYVHDVDHLRATLTRRLLELRSNPLA